MYKTSLKCKCEGHIVLSDRQMITLEGKHEGVSNFIYAIRSYILGNYDEAKKYARKTIVSGTKYENIVDCFVCDLSTLLLIILGEFELMKALTELTKLANSIPLIPLVWITLVEYWEKLQKEKIDNKLYTLELPYWDTQEITTNTDVLRKLINVKNDICESNYLKEVLLNTCGFATEWVPSIWNLNHLKCFLFTVTELTLLASKIGPLKYILKPI